MRYWRLLINAFREWYGTPDAKVEWTFKNVHKTNNRENGWAIVLATCDNGTPYRYLRWCPNEVWRWTSSKAMAEIFPSRKTAESAAMNCSVYYQSAYRIMEI